jgi:hypothetical protein
MRVRIWLPVLAIAACGGDPAPDERRERGRLGEEAIPQAPRPKPPKRDRHDIDIYVDAIPVATIGREQLAEWPRIDLQLPPDATLDRWKSIYVETDADPLIVEHPIAKHPDTVPVLRAHTDGSATFGMFDARAIATRGAPKVASDRVREIRIELMPDPRSARDKAFARACTEPKRGEEKPPPGKGRWLGTAYQFNIDQYWTIDMTVDLSDSKIGDKVGTVTYHGHKCRGNLYRLPDANGRRRVVERFWHNEGNICVEACILELSCDGTALDYRGLYPDGTYVAHAKLSRAK